MAIRAVQFNRAAFQRMFERELFKKTSCCGYDEQIVGL
jgi:hypothetical protein